MAHTFSHKTIFLFPVLILLSSVNLADHKRDTVSQSEFTRLTHQAQQLVNQFSSQLKPSLLKAIKEGGISHAIDVCAIQAPKLASQLEEQSGWAIKRVSLKPRNINAASPDSYERSVLEAFNQRASQGEAVSKLVVSTVTANQFRFMKAQPVDAICLNCHGTAISSEVTKNLEMLYPNEQATGYRVGDIRGAFSLSKALNNSEDK